jgi:hypothetical protein
MISQNTAILKALSFRKYYSTPLIEAAREIYKRDTGQGMSAGSTNRLRECREKGYIESQSDLFSEELEWNITDLGREHLKEKMKVFSQEGVK